jgi:hypothetical protein
MCFMKVVAEAWLTTFWIANTKQPSVASGHDSQRHRVFWTTTAPLTGISTRSLGDFAPLPTHSDPFLSELVCLIHLIRSETSIPSAIASQWNQLFPYGRNWQHWLPNIKIPVFVCLLECIRRMSCDTFRSKLRSKIKFRSPFITITGFIFFVGLQAAQCQYFYERLSFIFERVTKV